MNIYKVTGPDINNGIGIRLTIWPSGCDLHCAGCHNKDLWNFNIGKEFVPYKLLNYIVNVPRFELIYSGITIAGGNLSSQSDEDLFLFSIFLNMFKLRFLLKDIWIYSGHTYELLCKRNEMLNVLGYCDVLIDGPYIEKLRDRSLPFRGSSNLHIIYLDHYEILRKQMDLVLAHEYNK